MAVRKLPKEAGGPITRQAYEARLPTYEALREEAIFIISEAIEAKGIKTHSIESRVKTYESLVKKLGSKTSGVAGGADDIVGARVICLFKSDLDEVDILLEKEFEVIRKDDKIVSSSDSFGYMSIHYICRMKREYKGPRYSKIKGMQFEVQVRTLCMHAWAAISHYLDYKAEWDIPAHLRKGLNALSGLFYVADEQYERLYNARQESKSTADAADESGGNKATPINFDTVSAFLSRKFPDRIVSSSEFISELVKDIIAADYLSIEEVEQSVDSVVDKFKEDEQKTIKAQNHKGPTFYSGVGAVRISLKLASKKF